MNKTPTPAVARPMSRRAFTLVELLVVIAVIAVLLGILMPAYTGVLKEYLRHTCRSNLTQIGRGIFTYGPSEMNRGSGGAGWMPALATTRANWFSVAPGQGNMNGLWLLVQANYAEPGNFVCPEARRTLGHRPALFTGGQAGDETGFKWNTCSYSYMSQVGYSSSNGDTGGLSMSNADTTVKLVLLGDRNPRMQEGLSAPAPEAENGVGKNSKNHNREGQNFYLLNSQVLWVETLTGIDTRLSDDPFSPTNAADFSQGLRSGSVDTFLLQ